MEFKKAFWRSPEFVRTNNAGLAPYPTKAFEAVQYWNERYYREGVHADGDAVAAVGASRTNIAKFLGCGAEELGFTLTTAHSISQAAFGLKFQAGDEIITWDQEYPSNYYPWVKAAERSGAKLITVASGDDYSTPFEKLVDAFTSRTRVVAVSWVQYQTGAVLDLEKLSRETRKRGILLIVDAIQGLGARRFNFAESGVDILCGGSHKWLCSPLSTGFIVVRKDLIKDLEPIMVGAMTYGTPNDRPQIGVSPVAHASANRFEAGTRAFMALFGMSAAVDVIQAAGLDAIEKECDRLANSLRGGLREMGYKIHTTDQKLVSPIVTFSHATLPTQSVFDALSAKKIGCTMRGPGVRVSPHAFNYDEEIAAVLQTLRAHLPKR